MVKQEGAPNDLLDRIAADPAFNTTKAELEAVLDPGNFSGRSAEQVDTFVSTVVDPLLEANKRNISAAVALNV